MTSDSGLTKTTYQPDDATTVAVIPKNAISELRVQLKYYKAHPLVDVRLWGERDTDTERRPTRKGVCLHVSRLPALCDAVERALDEARRSGMLDVDDA